MKRMKVLIGKRRVMVIATLAILVLAAAALAASSASFTAQSANPNNVFAAGNLTMSNSRADTFILGATDMWPGQMTSGNVTVGNTGDDSAAFWLTMKTPVDTITAPGTTALSGTLRLKIYETATPANVVFDNALTAFPGGGINCGTFDATDTMQYTFEVTFPDTDAGSSPATRGSDNKYKNCSTNVEFDWEAVSN